jgi:hypothetical protein
MLLDRMAFNFNIGIPERERGKGLAHENTKRVME